MYKGEKVPERRERRRLGVFEELGEEEIDEFREGFGLKTDKSETELFKKMEFLKNDLSLYKPRNTMKQWFDEGFVVQKTRKLDHNLLEPMLAMFALQKSANLDMKSSLKTECVWSFGLNELQHFFWLH